MLIGDLTPLFMLEIAVRTTIMFLWLLALLRFAGQRSLAQLGPLELAIVIALGSAAGDPMFYPEVPLLHGMLTLALVVALQRGVSYLIVRNEQAETLLEGTPLELIRNGVLQTETMRTAKLSHGDVFEALRNEGVRQLGEVQRAYLEQNGTFSVFCHPPGQAPPGLQVAPPWDLEPPPAAGPNDLALCRRCGAPAQTVACTCGEKGTAPAVHDVLV